MPTTFKFQKNIMRSRAQETHAVFAFYNPLLTSDVKNDYLFSLHKSFKVPQSDLLIVYIVQKDIPFHEYQHPSPQKEGPNSNNDLAYHMYTIICRIFNLHGY